VPFFGLLTKRRKSFVNSPALNKRPLADTLAKSKVFYKVLRYCFSYMSAPYFAQYAIVFT